MSSCMVLFLSVGFGQQSVRAQAEQRLQSGSPADAIQVSEKSDDEILRRAARDGDLEKVKAALSAGAEVDATTEYGATALFFACDRGHQSVVNFLLKNGADPNVKDTFYKVTPVTWAQMKGHKQIIVSLLKNGGKGADSIFLGAITDNDLEYAQMVMETGAVSEKGLLKARDSVLRMKDSDKQSKLLDLFKKLDLPESSKAGELTPATLKRYEGKYTGEKFSIEVEATEESLKLGFNGNSKDELTNLGENKFSLGGFEFRFDLKNGIVVALYASTAANEFKLVPSLGDSSTETGVKTADAKNGKPSSEPKRPLKAPAEFGPSSAESRRADLSMSSSNWPGFRGNGSRGIADGQHPPIQWHVKNKQDEQANENLKWKVAVPGLGLSCPTIWGDDVYLTTAIAEGDDQGLKIGLYGDVDSIEDDREYEFKLMCFSKTDGSLKWERTANNARPAVKRHAKSSHANPTVATDGTHVVAFFGSEGLYCFSKKGELIWKQDLGLLDSGWFYDPGYQWGFGSSPLIYKDRVVVQCDIQGQSFVAAFELATGKEIWRTERDEIPTWSSPTVHEFGETAMLITGGTKSARGYDVDTGQLLWSLKGHSEIVVPTPFVAHDMIFLASGYSPIQPIYAVKPEARGDISLDENANTNASITWSVKRGGPYMPSPVVYGDYLYICSNNGILTCYFATTGVEVYKKRLKAPGGSLSFTASPIAADGHLFLPSEDGRVLVVKTGSEFELVNTNECGDSILATPAISDGVLFVRTQNSLIAVESK